MQVAVEHAGSALLVEDRAGNIWTEPGSNLVRLAARWFTPALVAPDSFAYLTSRPQAVSGEHRSELGVHAHGAHARELASQLTSVIREWDATRRNLAGPQFTLHPADATIANPADGKVFARRGTQIAVTWPAAVR